MRFQTLYCIHPSSLAAIVTLVTFAAKGGKLLHFAHLLQLTNKGLRTEKGKSGIPHIQVASSSSLIFRDWASWIFREFFQASIKGHRFPFQAKFGPTIVKVLFLASLGTGCRWQKNIFTPFSTHWTRARVRHVGPRDLRHPCVVILVLSTPSRARSPQVLRMIFQRCPNSLITWSAASTASSRGASLDSRTRVVIARESRVFWKNTVILSSL